MAKRPTIGDLAQAAGVSVATVDRVLNGRKSVRRATAIHVLDAARRIGFHAAPLLERRVADEAETLTVGLLLLSTEPDFYHHFRDTAEAVAAGEHRRRIRLVTEFLPSSGPPDIVAALRGMADRVQAIGLVSVDHPRVTEEVAALRRRGIPVFSLLSDFAQGEREAYIGTHNLKVGRTAAYMLARSIPRDSGAAMALFVGGHLWHGHDLRETGFRSYIRRERPDIALLDTQVNLDTEQLTYEATVALIARHPGLRGIYCAGGGRMGVIRAVRDEGRVGVIDIVANELTDSTRRALSEGLVSMVIDTPLRETCAALFDLAAEVARKGPGVSQGQVFVPLRLWVPESL